ncbi:hypothetical protein [Sphingobium yanoikuyae]|uniref:hypothetical protein n=1 Tax=Sphingobium yanoikuyae TaxID=13690 RepID=UPI003F0A6D9D
MIDALRLCLRLGQAMRIGAAFTLPRQDRASVIAGRTAGYQVAQDLKRRLNEILDHLVSARRETAPAGLLGAYGWIYGEWLAGADTTAAIVRPIVYEHAVRNEIMSSDEARLGNTAPPTLCIKQVAREWGFGYERTRGLLDAAGAIPLGSRAGVAFTIDPGVVRGIAVCDTSSISVKAAAQRLGTGAKQVRELVAVGLISLRADGRIFTNSLDSFENDLAAVRKPENAPDDARPLGQVAGVNAVSLHRVCKAVLDGDVSAWRGCGDGLSALLVRSLDVHRLRRPKADLSVECASRMLELHPDCVRSLHRDGIIPGPGARMTIEGLEKFKRTFIAGSKWARSAGIKPRAAVRHLAKAGVAPAFTLPKYRQSIYRKSELPPVN